jgi:hypothetical protein
VNHRELLQRAVPVFIRNAEFTLDTVRIGLLTSRIPTRTIESIVEFLPLAFARDLMDAMGISFPDEYVRVDADGRERLRAKLSDEPWYVESKKLAPEVMISLGSDAFMTIAGRSSELDAVNQALHAGSQPADLVFAPPVMMWRDEPPPPATKKPWWKLF